MNSKLPGLLLALIGFLSISASVPDAPKSKAEQFFQMINKEKAEKAFDALFEGSAFAEAKSEAIDALKEDFHKHLAKSGIIGWELVKEQAYGKSVVKLVYVLKLRSQPLIWEFHFYRAKNDWTLARVGFDEDLRKLD